MYRSIYYYRALLLSSNLLGKSVKPATPALAAKRQGEASGLSTAKTEFDLGLSYADSSPAKAGEE
jgi:hypothetical protein